MWASANNPQGEPEQIKLSQTKKKEKDKMEIGTKIKTHDNGYFGKIVSLIETPLGQKALEKNGIFDGQYVAYAAELDETSDSPKGFSTLVAKSDEALQARYAVA